MIVPGLNERIAAHAEALARGDDRAAEAFVSPAALADYRAAVTALASRRPFASITPLALAKIAFQYISKIALDGVGSRTKLLIRWRQDSERGPFMIAYVEDLTGKRSSWSDIPHYSAARSGASNG
jgi:hypothetical protein